MRTVAPLADRGADGLVSRQYLTFRIAGEEYAVDVLKVQEIRAYSPITPIPHAPASIKGVMNLRGAIIPVVDMRLQFGLPEMANVRSGVVVVVSVSDKTWGLLVDAVTDVLDIGKDDIQAAPDFGAATDDRFVAGLAEVSDKVVVLLDIERVLRNEQTASDAG